jgi:hypothetical protein
MKRRAKFGIWSSSYVESILGRRNTSRNDVKITKGIYRIVGIYCQKLSAKFPSAIDGKPHHMLAEEYEGTIWMRLVGDPLFVDKEECDSDAGGEDGGGNDGQNDGEVADV